jgi:hypothetical protein
VGIRPEIARNPINFPAGKLKRFVNYGCAQLVASLIASTVEMQDVRGFIPHMSQFPGSLNCSVRAICDPRHMPISSLLRSPPLMRRYCLDLRARTAMGPHHGEEDCLRGWRGSGTIFFSWCNMRCVFRQNHDISRKGHGAS